MIYVPIPAMIYVPNLYLYLTYIIIYPDIYMLYYGLSLLYIVDMSCNVLCLVVGHWLHVL